MQKLYIPASDVTPEILFSPEEKIFRIKGISRPENVREIYEPVVKWLSGYSSILSNDRTLYDEDNPFMLHFDLDYFNSSTAKFIYDIIMIIKLIRGGGTPTAIAWYYHPDDTDCLEAGEDMAEMAEMDFVYIKKQE
ncbi:MAG: DUF1987 domain-containing protein [Bacteroidales bacterium]|nr:DUF1987 domain-containing protein [Bacteroidales bacterium]